MLDYIVNEILSFLSLGLESDVANGGHDHSGHDYHNHERHDGHDHDEHEHHEHHDHEGHDHDDHEHDHDNHDHDNHDHDEHDHDDHDEHEHHDHDEHDEHGHENHEGHGHGLPHGVEFGLALIAPLLAGLGVAITAGITGCFVIWRRMAYFGDSLAHSSLLGIALGIALGIGLQAGTVIICTLFALTLIWLGQKKVLAMDTLLGILAHAALSFGLVALSLLGREEVDIHDFLFGDVMSMTYGDLWWMGIGGVIVVTMLIWRWQDLILMTVGEDLARAEGVHVLVHQMLLMFLMTIVVAVSMNVIGILLIASMLIIPPACARRLSNNPETMAVLSVVLGCIAVFMGVFAAVEWQLPAGPNIVVAITLLFMAILPISVMLEKRTR